ncbi:MAG: DNA mismatch repair protein [Oscillospiraceae bacterium]|nr:DNA mismatch repair protein [Oscillospiraceae bacterium]
MKENKQFSILFPFYEDVKYKRLSETVCHDLGLDTLCREITADKKEQSLIMGVISNMTPDPRVALYRQKVFADILNLPDLRKRMSELFDRIEYIRNFGSSHIASDEKSGFWHFMHRLDELDDYIECVEAIRECLSSVQTRSEGLLNFKKYIDELYENSCFAEMKRDIAELKSKAADVRSITLGINVNERFEAVGMGLVSINNKPFRKSNIISNFADAIASKNKIHDGTEWDGDMHYHQAEKNLKISYFTDPTGGYTALRNTVFANTGETVVGTPAGDGAANSTFYFDGVMNKMLDFLVKKLRDTLTKYSDVAIVNISRIIPELMYYIRFAEFISENTEKGFTFCEARLTDSENVSMDAVNFYNLKLALNSQISDKPVCNDLKFDTEHTVYILTGANRGGKTTVTQAVGLMFALAQGGIFVPASAFEYKPVDCIYTHFPADEDKTMDLGRLGEECVRFKSVYSDCTKDSLLLLNETFSTTSFEEGFYIARDSVKAILKKQVRTIYNTHMHKLAAEVDEMNKETGGGGASLIMKSDNGKRLFKLEAAPPEGLSYARDIAEKYGVTYEMLTN